jgi:hypothetical protein
VDEEALIYREEVRAIIGALADLVVDIRYMRTFVEELRGEEEGDEGGEE